MLIFHECPRCQLLATGLKYKEWELFPNSRAHGPSARKREFGVDFKVGSAVGPLRNNPLTHVRLL